MNFKLSEDSKKYLLAEARRVISDDLGAVYVNVYGLSDPDDVKCCCGCFVTIKNGGRLRGCVGVMASPFSLADNVRNMARSAAFEDGRFMPLDLPELERSDIEITVLSPMEEVLPSEVEAGRDGLYVVYGERRGVLLPQVAREQGWDRERFLENVCVKADLPPDAWKYEGVKLYRFEGAVFSEGEIG